jgi:SAM-dependent methyltransferase
MNDSPTTSATVRHAYTAHYYLEDCGGYETYRAHGGKRLDPRLDCMARLAGYHRGRGSPRLLDLGCGRGEIARHFAALGYRVDAIDYSPDALRLAEDCFAGEPKLRRRVRLKCASVIDPRAYRGRYDIVLASDLIEHLAPTEVAQLYALIRRHLKRDGVFIAHTFPNLWYYRYGYPRRRRCAALQGEDLPAEPRSHYELQMHINEQSPRIMLGQLRAAFEEVLLWAGDHQEPAGSLKRPFGKNGWRDAPSLFAIAARHAIDPRRVVAVLQEPTAPPEPSAVAANPPDATAPTRAQRLVRRLRRLPFLRPLLDGLYAFIRLPFLHQEVQSLRAALENQREQAPAARQPLQARGDVLQPPPDLGTWYQDFENHFRGSPQVIRERLQVYLPELDASPVSVQAPLLDLGCGRGDWLALLRDAGYPARGVDTNPAALAQARQQGLEVEQADVIDCLNAQPLGSLGAVSALHLVEHLPFEHLLRLLDAAWRALVPDGLLIIETPNPENLSVGACHFHTDPTHHHPLVPAVLEFTVAHRGFTGTRILRLNPDLPEHCLSGADALTMRLNAYLHGPRDYAVLAHQSRLNTGSPAYRFPLAGLADGLNDNGRVILDQLDSEFLKSPDQEDRPMPA